MTAESITNNAVSSLAANLSSSGTSLTLHTGDGSLFPSSNFRLTLGDPRGTFEVVLVGSRTGDACSSLTRGVEGTQQAWPVTTVVQDAWTAGAANALWTAISAIPTAGSVTDTAIGTRTPDDSVTAASGAQTLTNALSMLANAIKQISGASHWYSAPGSTIAAIVTSLAAKVAKSGDTMTGALTTPDVNVSDTTSGAMHLQFTGAAADPTNAGTTPGIRRSTNNILDIILGGIGMRFIKNTATGYVGVLQVDNSGNLAVLGGVPTDSASPGAAAIVKTGGITVTATTQQTVLTYTPAVDGNYRAGLRARINNGTSPNALTAAVTFTDADTGGSVTQNFFGATAGGAAVVFANGSNTIGNGVLHCSSFSFKAKGGNAITIIYRDPTNTPSDKVSAFLEYLGSF